MAAVIDLFSRRVVGWSMNANMKAQLVTDALIMAIWRKANRMRVMADHGITCSMSRSGNVWDVAAIESFFSSLETERTGRKVDRTRDDAKVEASPQRREQSLVRSSDVILPVERLVDNC